ncbi:hypothetical protein YDYSG_56610 [Paenibacillus tyrfis]|nr:hypothetical protein YDYSG_56610 [Paenibacillus tyrfis]
MPKTLAGIAGGRCASACSGFNCNERCGTPGDKTPEAFAGIADGRCASACDGCICNTRGSNSLVSFANTADARDSTALD